MLYTGNGDSGSSVLVKNGPAVPKSSALIEALGALDEINSFLGLCKLKAEQQSNTHTPTCHTHTAHHPTDLHDPCDEHMHLPLFSLIHEMQNTLFTIQAEVVTPHKFSVPLTETTKLQEVISQIENEIPPLAAFCIAGGTELSALLDIARTLARRAERSVITAVDLKETTLSPSSRAYLNRLSSALYALARYANHQAAITEQHPQYHFPDQK